MPTTDHEDNQPLLQEEARLQQSDALGVGQHGVPVHPDDFGEDDDEPPGGGGGGSTTLRHRTVPAAQTLDIDSEVLGKAVNAEEVKNRLSGRANDDNLDAFADEFFDDDVLRQRFSNAKSRHSSKSSGRPSTDIPPDKTSEKPDEDGAPALPTIILVIILYLLFDTAKALQKPISQPVHSSSFMLTVYIVALVFSFSLVFGMKGWKEGFLPAIEWGELKLTILPAVFFTMAELFKQMRLSFMDGGQAKVNCGIVDRRILKSSSSGSKVKSGNGDHGIYF